MGSSGADKGQRHNCWTVPKSGIPPRSCYIYAFGNLYGLLDLQPPPCVRRHVALICCPLRPKKAEYDAQQSGIAPPALKFSARSGSCREVWGRNLRFHLPPLGSEPAQNPNISWETQHLDPKPYEDSCSQWAVRYKLKIQLTGFWGFCAPNSCKRIVTLRWVQLVRTKKI